MGAADLDAAERFLQTALSTYSEIGQPVGQAASEEYLGEVYRGRGDTERAQQLWNQARERFGKVGLSLDPIGAVSSLA